jgi:uncharacterized glyoxalase superfamily protein PhnB
MKINKIDALIFTSSNVSKTADFYKGLGLELVDEKHGDGPIHYACEFGGVHFAIFETSKEGKASPQEFGGSTKIGLNVDDVDEAYEIALNLGAESKLKPDNVPWGRNAVIIDPDGRTVEFNGLVKEAIE